ncbi:hypothetical protein BOO92_13745 [Vibrio navarrensis]|nr:hypothetical protein [Vibrio navarrensis]MBH9739951.1 hypothetical protein [Vibrio navarrensis]
MLDKLFNVTVWKFSKFPNDKHIGRICYIDAGLRVAELKICTRSSNNEAIAFLLVSLVDTDHPDLCSLESYAVVDGLSDQDMINLYKSMHPHNSVELLRSNNIRLLVDVLNEMVDV